MVDLTSPASIGGNTAFSSGVDYMFAVVKEVNDRPIFDKSAVIALSPVGVNDADPSGNTVDAILKTLATDQDAGTNPGLAVTGFSKKGGTWQYQLAGESGWTNIPAVNGRAAWLMDRDDKLRFLPDGVTQGTATLSVKAWDQTVGVAGTLFTSSSSAFSRKVSSVRVVVSASPGSNPNTAPTLDTAPVVTFTPIDEDSKPEGNLVSSLVLAGMSDPDAGTQLGVAVTGLTGSEDGVWQYSLNGKQWKNVGNVSEEVALLLADVNRIRFLPNANNFGSATVSFHAWDRTVGTPGQYANLALPGNTGGSSAFSTAEDTASITINPVNDRPILNLKPNPVLNSIPKAAIDPAGTKVSTLLGSAFSDVDNPNLQGIAVSNLPLVLGEWQYRLDGQTFWTTLSGSGDGQVMPLGPNDEIRLLAVPQFAGKATIQYRAWDQSTGIAGIFLLEDGNNSISEQEETATVHVGMPNFRPILDTKPIVTLPSVPLNAANPAGFLVSTLLGNNVIDADAEGLYGIAITGLDVKNGTWQYAIDGGAWFTLSEFTGVSLLLKSTDTLRFIPNANYAGSATLKFKAWDQSEGVAGNFLKANTGAFSKATETAVISVNTAPTLTW